MKKMSLQFSFLVKILSSFGIKITLAYNRDSLKFWVLFSFREDLLLLLSHTHTHKKKLVFPKKEKDYIEKNIRKTQEDPLFLKKDFWEIPVSHTAVLNICCNYCFLVKSNWESFSFLNKSHPISSINAWKNLLTKSYFSDISLWKDNFCRFISLSKCRTL